MTSQLLPASIMFLMTILIAALFLLPPTQYSLRNKIMNFYWAGFWMFLAAIWSISASMSTMTILGLNHFDISNAILFAVVLCFIVFVVFGWFRLSALALVSGAKKLKIRN